MKRFKGVASVILLVVVAALMNACGGGTAAPTSTGTTNPGGNSGTCSVAVGPLGCPRGLIVASVDGQTVNFGVSNGSASYTPIAANPALGLPAQDFIVIVGVASNTNQISLTTRAKVGQSNVGLNVIDAETRNVSVNAVQYITPTGAPVAPGWQASVAGGSGTITVDSVSTSGA